MDKKMSEKLDDSARGEASAETTMSLEGEVRSVIKLGRSAWKKFVEQQRQRRASGLSWLKYDLRAVLADNNMYRALQTDLWWADLAQALIYALPEMELYLEKDEAERKEADHSQMQGLVSRVTTTAANMLAPPSMACTSDGEWLLVASPDDLVAFVSHSTCYLTEPSSAADVPAAIMRAFMVAQLETDEDLQRPYEKALAEAKARKRPSR